MAEGRLRILQVNTTDVGGGAAKVAGSLLQAYCGRGYGAWLAVGYQQTAASQALIIPHDAYREGWARLWVGIGNLLSPMVGRVRGAGQVRDLLSHRIGQPRRWFQVWRGHEDFDFPATWHILDLPPERLDILHCHNLHGDYFDLYALPWLSQQVPVFLTLHDAWLLSGHCAHSFDCERWKTGCGHCPDLTIYPAIRRDGTAYNWMRKKEIITKCRLYVATPSQWLMQKVEQSILAPAVVESRVIPNGTDLSIFHPADKQSARRTLGIPQDAKVCLLAAKGIGWNIFRDYHTMRAAVAQVAARLQAQEMLFIALGEDTELDRIGHAGVRLIPYQKDPKVVASYYQAADIYVHAAHADTFPNTVLEALACGTPVVATVVGGIPEQIKNLEPAVTERGCSGHGLKEATGVLVPPGDAEGMATGIQRLLSDEVLRRQLGENAAEDARCRFDLNRQVEAYLEWYQQIVERQNMERSTFQCAEAEAGLMHYPTHDHVGSS